MTNGPQLLDPVYNKKRKVSFGCLVADGWFSAAPDDTSVNRAIRTNNPGALNISKWQRTRPGYVGQTAADAAGNITAIYQAPEYGVSVLFAREYLRVWRCGDLRSSDACKTLCGG